MRPAAAVFGQVNGGWVVDDPLDVTVEGPGLEQFQVEVGRTGKIGSAPVRPEAASGTC